MRFGFGLIGLLLAVVIVGVLAKKQLSASRPVVPSVVPAVAPLATGDSAQSVSHPQAQSVREQSQQLQNQIRQQLDTTLQQPRAEPQD